MIQGTSNNIDSLLKHILQQRQQVETNNQSQKVSPQKETGTALQDGQQNQRPIRAQTQDIVAISSGKKPQTKQSNLVSENIEKTQNGFQKTQEFENAQGRKFTRIEDVETTENRSKRTVIQQNDSGSTTILENVVDRQDDGSFRLIERFTDETGETKTNVTFDFNPAQAGILLGTPASPPTQGNNPFSNPRGSQVDLTV